MKAVFALLFLSVAVSCSSWDRERCLTTDWYQKGVEDSAADGSGNFHPYKRACAKEGISVAGYSSDYEKGVLEGMRSWCNFQNGFNQGLEGRNATSKCDRINPAFARGVEEGYREFRVTQRRKRDEDEREKRYRNESEDFRRRVLGTSDTKECFVDSDCKKSGSCVFSRCQHNNQTCTFSSDCEIRGYCREVSEYNSAGQRLSLRVCDFDR